jgi:RimJ/RimL family protein N-acetyltransferase
VDLTDRLVLRRFTAADADNLVSLDADPDALNKASWAAALRPGACDDGTVTFP